MKRLVTLLAVAMAVPAFGLTRSPRPGDRIGVLRMSEHFSYGAERMVANALQHDLRDELLKLGFSAFDARLTYDDVRQRGAENADFYVEVISSRASGRPMGGVGAAVGNVAVEVAVVVGQVAAEVRLYDGRTLNLIERYDLEKRGTAVVPTGIGIGGRSIWASIMLPFVEYGQYRAAAHDVARQAAARIAGQ